MGKGKIEVKKICNESARQVTFSKRKRGLFKKAQELAILCDAQVGVVLFSPAGKLFQFSSNSMQEIIERRAKHLQDASKLILPRGKQKYSTGQSESFLDETSKDTLDFRQMNGEDIGELTTDELHKLERRVKDKLFRVIEKKGEKMLEQVNNLHNVGQKLMVENALLKKEVEFLNGKKHEEDNKKSTYSTVPRSLRIQDSEDCFETSLRLGFPLYAYGDVPTVMPMCRFSEK